MLSDLDPQFLDPDPQATNTTRSYGLELAGPEGGSLSGVFDGTEAFRVVLWAGDRRLPAWQSDTACAWAEGTDFLTPGAPLVVVLTIPRAAIEGLEGTYDLQVLLNPDVDDIELWAGQVRFTAPAGTEAPPPAYATVADLEDEYPGIRALLDQGRDQAGFAEVRAWARRQVDKVLLARAAAELRDFDRMGVWDQTRRAGLEQLEALLAADRLAVTPELRRICALYTLGRVLLRQTAADGATLKEHGLRYLTEAHWVLTGYVGKIDADGDGVYELEVG